MTESSIPSPMPVRKRRDPKFAWFAAGACLLTLLTLTHIPMKPDPPDRAFNDSYEHFTAYFSLGATFTLAGLLTWPRKWWLPVVVFLCGATLGGIDELTQPLTGRTCDPRDWHNDMIGLAVAALLVPTALRLFRGRKQPRV